MKNISKFEYCYGCAVCASACPKKTISMRLDANGFFRPEVDETNCIECGICLDVCSFNHREIEKDDRCITKGFAAWSKDVGIRQLCTSGGVSFEIGRFLISQNYVAVVCRYNSQSQSAEHYIADSENNLKDSIGSKYIQSDTFKAFSRIQKGQKYFIAGTPCQIDSIRRWLRKRQMEDDVILLDFFCHGVPSMLLWDKYLHEIENRIGRADTVIWRDKETGWHDSWVIKVPGRYASWFSRGDLFYKMFLGDRCLGLQCYHDCKYKYDKSAADIRIGDLWGRKFQNDENGVNGVISFTRSGEDLLKKLSQRLHIEPLPIAIVGESQMKRCARKPISYNFVMNSLRSDKTLEEIDRRAYQIEIVDRVYRKFRYYLFRFPSKMLEILRPKANNKA